MTTGVESFEWDALPTQAVPWQALTLPPLADRSVLKAQVFSSTAAPCSYRPTQHERMQIAQAPQGLEPHVYGWLATQGFRRSGSLIYRPHCPTCRSCQSLRVCADAFTPTRSQRRAWSAHAHLQSRALPLHASAEHYALYRAYQNVRHASGDMKDATPEQYRDFIARSPVRSVLVEFREQPRPKSPNEVSGVWGTQGSSTAVQTAANAGTGCALGELRMVSLVDVLPDGLSAVYTFYASDDRSDGLGTFGVLWQIALARKLGLPFVYLGYWIQEVQNMRYKEKFQPHQLLVDKQWFYSIAPILHRKNHDWDFPGHEWD